MLVGILKGSFIFLADLVRLLDFPLEVESVRLSSYGGGRFRLPLIIRALPSPTGFWLATAWIMPSSSAISPIYVSLRSKPERVKLL